VEAAQTIGMQDGITISRCHIRIGGLAIRGHGIHSQTSGTPALLACSKAMASATTIQTTRMFP